MITKNPEETIELGRKFAENLKGGEVIGLIGNLGSGKTTFIKGLAEGLRVDEIITSPTFVILKSYAGRIGQQKIEFVHVDAYRVESIEDIESVGINDFLGRKDVIIAIEWSEKIEKILPKGTKYVNFEHINENERKIVINH